MSQREAQLKAFGKLLDVLDRLRVECPWDAKQTNESLRPNTIEEVYELSDALLGANADNIKKELGDVLLHVVFYAKIGEEKGQFDIESICTALTDKLIYRHPHIFGTTEVNSVEQVEQNWEQLKLREKGGNKTVLSGVPHSLPALIKAQRIQEKVANVGFDWHHTDEVWAKVEEELTELRTEVEGNASTTRKEGELGDFLFSIINMARRYHLNADTALERTNRKFTSRFNYIEAQAKATGRELRSLTLEEMDALWNQAKEGEPPTP